MLGRWLAALGDDLRRRSAVEPLVEALRDRWQRCSARQVANSAQASALESAGRTLIAVGRRLALQDWAGCVRLGGAAVEPLVAALRDSDTGRCGRQAAEALGRLGDVRAVEPLVAALHDSMRACGRRRPMRWGRLGTHAAVEPLVAALATSRQQMCGRRRPMRWGSSRMCAPWSRWWRHCEIAAQ